MKKTISKAVTATAKVVAAIFAFILSPHVVATILLICGIGLAVAGIHFLFGSGWALLAAAVQVQFVAFVLFRGMNG